VTNPRSRIFSLPLLNRGVRLEVVPIFEIQSFILAVEFSHTFFSALNDGVDVVDGR
jgi:hypothetical protein